MLPLILCALQGAAPTLPAAPGWEATVVHDRGDIGVWTVKAFQVFPNYGTPEVVGLDDKGRLTIHVHYSGKWTPMLVFEEGEWLGGLDHADLDPRAAGAELYTGGKRGNLYQVRAYPFGATDHRLIARFPGEEVHTLLAGEFDASNASGELLVFTSPGALYRVTPTGADGGFEAAHITRTPGRVRDALALPLRASEARPRIATVSRSGELALLTFEAGEARWQVIHTAQVGQGRVALAPDREGRGVVLYTTQDDGVVLRHAETATGAWSTSVVYRGPTGPRGVCAGRFTAGEAREEVVVFGYSGAVELLTCAGSEWKVETLFTDRAGGHWLDVLELDSRNATDEIVASGYGGRIVMLSRTPGYGFDGAVPAQSSAAPNKE